jgi:hypothetical protein
MSGLNLQTLASFLGMQGGFNQQANQQTSSNQQQTNLANTGWNNANQLAQGGWQQDANLANTGWQNANQLAQGQFNYGTNLANAGWQNDASQWNSGANNQMSQFNATMRDQNLARLLQGSQIFGGLGSDYGNQSRADVGTQMDAGNNMYAIDAARAMAPLSLNQMLSQMYGQFPLGNFTGQNVTSNGTLQGTNIQTSTPSPFNIGMSLASLFAPSDPAFKTDISPAGRENGLNLYNYRYRWDEPDMPLRTGVMADEVEDVRPDAVSIIDGMRMVDYGALGLSHLVEA